MPKNTFLQLAADEPWDTFKAQLLVKVDGVLNSTTIAFEDYGFNFLVPHIHTKLTDLTDEDSYRFMVECALKGKDPAISITVKPRARSKRYHSPASCYRYLIFYFYQRSHDSDKENDTESSCNDSDSDSDSERKKK